MNTDRTEELLRKAPRLPAPGGLRAKLEADIALPQPARPPQSAGRANGTPWLRRWLPALSLSTFLLGCLVAIAVQSNLISGLRQQNEALRAAREAAEDRAAAAGSQQRLAASPQELERLRRDAGELQKLQQEAAQAREDLQDLSALRSENQRLMAEMAAAAQAQFPPGVTAEDDVFGRSKAKAQAVNCISNIKQICLAARLWANDHNDVLPPDFQSMKNELVNPKILVCSGDTGRVPAPDWSQFGPANVSYEMLSPGVDETDPRIVFVRCPIHGNVGLVDGSAHQLPTNGTRRVVFQDGKYLIGQ